MKKIFVTGASGFVGRNVCRELVRTGYDVTGLSRNKEGCLLLKKMGVKCVIGDINNTDSLKSRLSTADILIHLAAQRVNWGIPGSIYKTNSDSIRELVEIGRKLSHVVVTSSVYVYGDQKGLLSESNPLLANDIYGKSKIRLEQTTRDICHTRGVKYTIIRPAIVYGSDMDSNSFLMKLIHLVRTKNLPIVGSGHNLIQLIHVKDLARGYLAAVRKGGNNKTYNFAFEKPVFLIDLVGLVKKKYGVEYKNKYIWRMPITLIAILFEVLYGFGLKVAPKLFKFEPPISRIKLRALSGDWNFDTSAAQKDLGFRANIDYKQGIEGLSIDV